MTEKKISRRDAMKVLGAAVGAAALSTLPSKWNTPELAAGVLPAHAAQSALGSITGFVYESNNGWVGAPGVFISVDGFPGKTATTDGSGQYTISGVPLGPQTVTVDPTTIPILKGLVSSPVPEPTSLGGGGSNVIATQNSAMPVTVSGGLDFYYGDT